MRAVSKLKKRKKKIVVVASGKSAFGLNVPEDMDCMAINYAPLQSDYRVCDKKVPQELSYTDEIIIGFKDDPVDFYFDDSIKLGDHSGFRALQIATLVMGYDETYLIGYDYYDDGEQVHYFGDEMHKYKLGWDDFFLNRKERYKIWLSDFDTIDWSDHDIYNCNSKSELKLFEFRSIR